MYGNLSLRTLVRTTFWVVFVSSVINEMLALLGILISSPPSTFGPYHFHSVVGLTVIGVAGAGAVYGLMRRYVPDVAKVNRYFTYLSMFVLVVSFYPDIAMPWSTDPDQIGWTYGIMANLMLMHVVAAGLVLHYFTRRPLRS